MKLSECTIGTIVTNKNDMTVPHTVTGEYTTYYAGERIGYVQGLTTNSSGETIPFIEWSDCFSGYESMHHSNLSIYED